MADKKAVSTIGTILEVSADGSAWEKMTPIKSYLALGGEREQLETTDMEDETQTSILFLNYHQFQHLFQSSY